MSSLWQIAAVTLTAVVAFTAIVLTKRRKKISARLAQLRSSPAISARKDFELEALSSRNVRLIRYTDFFSCYSVCEEDLGQEPEGSEIILKGKQRCLAGIGLVRNLTAKLPPKEELLRVFSVWRELTHRGNVVCLARPAVPLEELTSRHIEESIRFLAWLERSLSPSWDGGTFTVRNGFAARPYAWNWNEENLRIAVSNRLSSFCFSYYAGEPYLNRPIIELMTGLCGERDPIWVFRKNLFTRPVAAGFRFSFSDGILSGAGNDAIMSLDWLDEGSFTALVLPKEGREKAVERIVAEAPDHDVFGALMRNISDIEIICRRLYDWEASWYSGEYEVISRGDITQRAACAINELAPSFQPAEEHAERAGLAARYKAKVEALSEPFNVKLFASERFARS